MASKSLQEKLSAKRKKIKDRQAGGSIIFPKEGTLRFRVLPQKDPDADWAVEAKSFYLGAEIKGVISPSSPDIGDDCPILEKYEELKASNKAGDDDIAKRLVPRSKYLVPVMVYTDETGKEVNTQDSGKLLQLPTGIYLEMIDLYLDPEMPDFVSATEGFDFKLKRTGKGKQDTEYTITPLPHKVGKIDKAYSTGIDVLELFKKEIKSYEDLEDLLVRFLVDSNFVDDDEEEEKPKADKKPRRKSKKRSK